MTPDWAGIRKIKYMSNEGPPQQPKNIPEPERIVEPDSAELNEEIATGEQIQSSERGKYRVERNYDQIVQEISGLEKALMETSISEDARYTLNYYIKKIKKRAVEGLDAARKLTDSE